METSFELLKTQTRRKDEGTSLRVHDVMTHTFDFQLQPCFFERRFYGTNIWHVFQRKGGYCSSMSKQDVVMKMVETFNCFCILFHRSILAKFIEEITGMQRLIVLFPCQQQRNNLNVLSTKIHQRVVVEIHGQTH